MKVIVKENERGLLFKNGVFEKMLNPGKYRLCSFSISVDLMDITKEFKLEGYDINIFLKDGNLTKNITIIDIPDQAVALHYKNGKFVTCIASGKYAFWNIYDKHEFMVIDIKDPEVKSEVPKFIFDIISSSLYSVIEVPFFQKAKLYYDNKFIKLLDEGTYYFWNNGTKVSAKFVDSRMLQMDISGQEMLTLDKVTLRINFVCNYKIRDYIKIDSEIDNYEEQIHIILQLALREYIGKYRLDEILENKELISEYAFKKIKEKETELYITVYGAGVKDIILPGEIRDIMNTVLIAEKKAQANVITRREEVASTRSLLNTAKLMDENQTLYKLKEMEYLERICSNVGNITVNGGDLIGQLTKLLKGNQL